MMISSCVLVAAVLSLVCSTARGSVKLSHFDDLPSEGQTSRVSCTVSGEAFLGWFKVSGGQQIPSGSQRVHVSGSGDTFKLVITSAQLSDAGAYECRGSLNDATYNLYIKFKTEDVDTIQNIRIGQTGEVQLSVNGFPTPSFKWSKNNVPLDTSSSRYSVDKKGTLRISGVKIADQGNYSCIITQLSGRVEEQKDIEVFVFDPPKFVQQPNPPLRYLTEGYNTTFQCKAVGLPIPQYEWLNPNNGTMSTFGRFQVTGGVLTIKNVLGTDIGKYTCKAYSIIKQTSQTVGEVHTTAEIVEVYVKPEIVGLDKEVELEKGKSYQLKCTATGTPLPVVVWQRGGMRDPRQVATDGKSTITFGNIQVTDSGLYTCEASNKALDSQGNPIVVRGTTQINIQSKPVVNLPGSPREVFSFVGNDRPVLVVCAYFGFPAPWVEMRMNGKLVANNTGKATAKLITDTAEYFGTYNCFARNKFGSQNHTVELKFAEAPGAVRNLRAEATCDSVTFLWDRPEEDGGMPIRSYVLNYGSTTRNIRGEETSFTLKGLERNKRYDFSLRATNRADWGPKTKTGITTKEYCKPGRPIIYSPLSSILDSNTFTLMWRRPEETGGDPEISYKVRYTEVRADGTGKVEEKTTKNLQIEITGLEVGTKYKFEIFATNKGGDSEPTIKFYQIPSLGARSGSNMFLPTKALIIVSMAAIFHVL